MTHRLSRCSALVALLLALLAGLPEPARSAAGPWVENEQVSLRLIAAGETVGDGGTLRLGLQMKLQPGWKTYWRSPGDAGHPPSIDWSGSQNLAAAEMAWPVPHRFSLFGLETFGYEDEVVFPLTVEIEDPTAPLRLSALVDYLVCEEICIPYQERLALELPPGPPGAAREGFLIDRFRARVPGNGRDAGLALGQVALAGSEEAPLLEVAVASSASPLVAPDLLVEGPMGFRFGKPEVSLKADGSTAVLRAAVDRGAGAEGALLGQPITLTVIDGSRGLEATTTLQAPPPRPGVEYGFLAILGLAVLGGLILNLMPCVLPVLSIKLLSAIGHGGGRSGAVRLSFLASAAGILFSFLLLAGAAIAVKAAGLAVGWGIQFQQPLFLAGMALIVTLFAGNLFGFFEILLPGWLSGVASGGEADGHSLGGHFLTGAFATLLATPCSAPFLGTAVGFALSAGALEILAVFAALGVGLALPYLLVAAAPGLATRLPRPGPWMIVLRRVLGLALLGTAAWLVSVLAVQIGATAALAIGAALLLLLVVLHLRRRPALPRIATGAAGLLLALTVPALALLPPGREPPASSALAADWRPLDVPAIARLVDEGRVVFVDVTADWCLTCQVNKSLVLDQDPVATLLADPTVVRMRGDWTLPDDSIAAYLASFGRYGIPFNAVYGPDAPQGLALPELLTDGEVLQALDQAGEGRFDLAGD